MKPTFGCTHYKRNCKLLAACCNQLYACINCHDEVADHSMERKATTKMMCMKCFIVQPITCTTISCDNISMAKYYCRICKMFDDQRVCRKTVCTLEHLSTSKIHSLDIYHCPYWNLC